MIQPSKKLSTERRSPMTRPMSEPSSMERTSPANTRSRVLPMTRYAAAWLNIEITRFRSARGEGRNVGRKNSDTPVHTSRRPIADTTPGKTSGLSNFTAPSLASVKSWSICFLPARL